MKICHYKSQSPFGPMVTTSTLFRKKALQGGWIWMFWDVAQREGRILITQDLDFSDIRKFQPGTHYGIVVVRLQAVRQ